MNPFDIKTILFAKHAQHVVLIHFPIALFILGVAFDFAAHWSRKQRLAVVAYYNLLAAALFTIPTLATGVLAWRFALEGQHLKGILLLHLILAWCSSLLIWFAAWLHCRAERKQSALPGFRLFLEAAGVSLLMLTAHLGGFLSGINGAS